MQIGFVAKDGDGHDLIAFGLRLLDGRRNGLGIGQGRHLAKQVNDGHADLGGNDVSHG